VLFWKCIFITRTIDSLHAPALFFQFWEVFDTQPGGAHYHGRGGRSSRTRGKMAKLEIRRYPASRALAIGRPAGCVFARGRSISIIRSFDPRMKRFKRHQICVDAREQFREHGQITDGEIL
jgi:hypothetical protein